MKNIQHKQKKELKTKLKKIFKKNIKYLVQNKKLNY